MSAAPEASGGEPLPEVEGYELLEELGRGTTGVVFRARQVSVDREVALKIMHAELVRNARSIKRLKREARTAARLAHPNLITSFDMGESGGSWWFAMELVHGESLAERLERSGRLREDEALALFMQLCDAVDHASRKGVVHRDIKPANILLEADGTPRLVDLGLARVEDDPLLTRTGATLGTPHYISPEQARDPALADVRSDLWSLGATLFHAVCGRPPFTGRAAAEILSDVLYGAIPNPSELRPELSRGLGLVLRKCLSRDPERRYHTAAELRDDLERVRAHKAPAIKESALEPLDPARGEARRRGLLWAGLGALGLILVVALLITRPWQEPSEPTGDEGVVDVEAFAPLARLRADLEAGDLLLGDALRELETLHPRVPPSSEHEWRQTRDALWIDLEEALFHVKRQAEQECARRIETRDFAGAREYVQGQVPIELAETTGLYPAGLPRERDLAKYERWAMSLVSSVDRAEEAARSTALARIRAWADGVFFKRLDRLQKQGQWIEVRAALASGVDGLLAASGADLSGLESAAVIEELPELRLELEARSQRLEREWFQLDSRMLRREVDALADGLRAQLEAREALRVDEAFEAGFEELLARHRLDRETLEASPEHHSLDRYRERAMELFDLQEMLLEADAGARLSELDLQVEPRYTARRYEDALEFWEGHLGDDALQTIRDRVAIRVEEAQELVAFLERAAAGVRAREGQEVSLRQGSIAVRGRLELRGDPLARGFNLRISSSAEKTYLLREEPGQRGERLGASALEVFALGGADLSRDLGLFKQRILFRYREGDYEGAAELFGKGLLADGELLVYELGLRIDSKLGREQALDSKRRAYAAEELERLTQPGLPQGDRVRVALRISRLLRDYGDVLEPAEEARLRSRREALQRDVPRSTLDEFRGVFGPNEVRFWSQDRVGMDFEFDRDQVGAWQRGAWDFVGGGWRGQPISSLEALERVEVPTLLLHDPLQLDEGTTVITVRMRQPLDSPPELLVVSALGFHVACAGPLDDRSSSLLADTTGLVDVATRAREGKGVAFAGLTVGAEHELRIEVSRASGKVKVQVDGVHVLTANRVSPRGHPRSSSISVRSFEPIVVEGVSVEGTRR